MIARSLTVACTYHLNSIFTVTDIQCNIHEIRRVLNYIECRGKEFRLLRSRHGGQEKNNAGVNLQLLISSAEFKGVVRDESPIFLGYRAKDIPILRPMEPMGVDVSGCVSAGLGDLRQ